MDRFQMNKVILREKYKCLCSYLKISLRFSHKESQDKLSVAVDVSPPGLEQVRRFDELWISQTALLVGEDGVVGRKGPRQVVGKVVPVDQGHVGTLQPDGKAWAC